MDPDNLVLTYERFIKDTEIVKFKNGTYEEITSHADTRKVMFQSRAKPTWDSVLTNLPEEVDGLTQKLVRLYDVDRDIFGFQTVSANEKLNVKQILSQPPIWNGEDLSSSDILKLCDEMIDMVT